MSGGENDEVLGGARLGGRSFAAGPRRGFGHERLGVVEERKD
jgi:hypothetical protein